jgi:hypothetical protein
MRYRSNKINKQSIKTEIHKFLTTNILSREGRTNTNTCHEKNKNPNVNHFLFPSLHYDRTKQQIAASLTDQWDWSPVGEY